MSKALSVADIKALFPNKELAPISSNNERPTWQTINNAKLKLNANALTIDSSVGGGAHGHLFLLNNAADYLTITGEAYTLPINPGPLPIYPLGATAAQINAATMDHANEMSIYRTSRNVDIALRNSVLASIEEQFIANLFDDVTGFGSVTTIEILNHLSTTYGVITREQMKMNLALFNSDWCPPTPIENLFQRFKQCRSFAIKGGNPINDVTTVDAGYDIILRGGMHSLACTDWRKIDSALQTYDAFKLHFTKYEVDRRLVATSETHGFAANAATATATAAATQANLISAAVQEAVRLAMQPLQNQLARANLAAAAPAGNRNPGDAMVNADAIAAMGPDHNYCWTHGYISNPNHQSANCRARAPGHFVNATARDPMGGSRRIYTEADRRPRAPLPQA
jgi:hypothetical protein